LKFTVKVEVLLSVPSDYGFIYIRPEKPLVPARTGHPITDASFFDLELIAPAVTTGLNNGAHISS